MPVIRVRGLSADVGKLKVLNGVDLDICPGEVHALMGPNGSGKSSLTMTLMGSRQYIVKSGEIYLEKDNLLSLTIDERARRGLFVAWQNPLSIPGVSVFSLCKTAYEAQGHNVTSVVAFRDMLSELLLRVGLTREHLGRSMNEGFSGGEKKRLELVQLLLLKPKLALLDEIDSGLDVDALKLVGDVVAELAKKGTSFLLITHYKRLLEYVSPSHVHVMKKGVIVASGGTELVAKIESHGYTDFK